MGGYPGTLRPFQGKSPGAITDDADEFNAEPAALDLVDNRLEIGAAA